MPKIPNRYGMVVKEIGKAYKTEANRNIQMQRTERAKRSMDINMQKVLGVARHRLGRPINARLDDEISISERSSRGLYFDCE